MQVKKHAMLITKPTIIVADVHSSPTGPVISRMVVRHRAGSNSVEVRVRY
jgi:hypothetical protein